MKLLISMFFSMAVAGCATPLLLLETTEPPYHGNGISRTRIVKSDGTATTFLTSNRPALALACDPFATTLARAILVDDSAWVLLYSTTSGKPVSIYRLPGESSSVELLWPFPGRLVAVSDDKIHVIIPGKKPDAAGNAKAIVYDRSGLKLAAFGNIDLPEKSPAGLQVAMPEGLRPLCFNPRGNNLLAVDEEGVMHLVDTRTGTSDKLPMDTGGLSIPRVTGACFSSDGRLFFMTAVADGKLGLYYGLTSGRSAYAGVAPVISLSGKSSLEIVGFARDSLYLIADETEVYRYNCRDKSLNKIYAAGGRIRAFCPMFR